MVSSVVDYCGNVIIDGDYIRSSSGKKYKVIFNDEGIVLEGSSSWIYKQNKDPGTKQFFLSSDHPVIIPFSNFTNTRWYKAEKSNNGNKKET